MPAAMGPRIRAAIYIHLGTLASRQQQARYAQQYCERQGYEPTTLVWRPDAAIRLVQNGHVDVIVCAYLPHDRQDLADLVAEAGGRLEAARAGSRVEREIGKLIAKLFQHGMTIAEIADVTERGTCEIRTELRRRGLDG